MTKPLKPQAADDFDALAALAADAEEKAASLPVEVREVVEAPAEPPVRRTGGIATTQTGVPLAYRRSATAAAVRDAAANRGSSLVDPVRDQYVPSALLALGTLAYTGFMVHRYHVEAGSLAMVIMGISILTVLKTALLVGGAFLLAGPLGVGFGDLKSAILKLAAIAVVSDAAADWADHLVSLAGGGRHAGAGGVGYGILGWFVSVCTYWGLMVYLFSMDIADARVVVVCLSVMSRIVRFAIVMIIFSVMVGSGAMASPTGGAAAGPVIRASALSTHVDDMKQAGQLAEARQYIADGHQLAAKKSVDAWYAAGCPNVWYEMSGRDINGRRSALGMVVQLPEDPAARRKAMDVMVQYDHDVLQVNPSMDELRDTGESYLELDMR